MAKRPSSLEALIAGGTAPEIAPAPVPPPAPAKSIEKLTVYMPRAAAKRIKQMALDHDRRVNDFLQEGVEMMLARYGEPPLKDFETR